MEILTTEINALVNVFMAQQTWKTYKTAVESFKTFRSLYQLRYVWPAPMMSCIILHIFITQVCQSLHF